MDEKSGWVEKRQHERIVATLKVNFHVIRSDEAQRLLENERYKSTTAELLPELSQKSNLYKAVTKDISLGGLALVSQEPLSRGMLLEINLQLPSYHTSLKFLAKVMHTETFEEMGKTLYTAGMQTLAISKDDVQKIADYLVKQNKEKH